MIGAPTLIKTAREEIPDPHDLSGVEPSSIRNPVGYLQELMQKNGLEMPDYSPGNELVAPFSHTVKIPATGQTCTGQGQGHNSTTIYHFI